MDVQALIAKAGGITALGRKLGVSKQTVHAWVHRGIPETRQAWIRERWPEARETQQDRSGETNRDNSHPTVGRTG